MTAGLETFAKVRALHDSTTHAGEKASAAARMAALARRAGMTVAEAVSRLDGPRRPPSPAEEGGFADFFDSPAFRDGLARHERERAARWREILAEYGSEEAVFEPGPMERALDEAADRFGPDPGWQAYPLTKVPAAIVATVEAAWPMPASVRAAWVEFAFWDKLGRDREARGTACGDHSPAVQLRSRILERLLDTAPAASLDDMRARLDWFDYLNHAETAPDPKEERIRLAALRADIERMGERMRQQEGPPVQNGHQGDTGRDTPSRSPEPGNGPETVQSGHPHRPTRAERHAAIRTLLAAGHTDREVARRLAISPTTVGAVRRRLAEEGSRP